MRNLSIRTKFVALVMGVNLVGAVTVGLYLHQSFSGGLAVAADESVSLAKGVWEDVVTRDGKALGFTDYAKAAPVLTARLKKITGAEYGLLLEKRAEDEKAYKSARVAANLPDNWSEGDAYLLAGVTDDNLAPKMRIKAGASSIPDAGKVVGIENGACSKTCHGSVKGQGDFWGVSWSSDSRSRAYTVVPISDGTGKPIGLLYSVRDISSQADADRTALLRTLALIAAGLAGGAIAIVLAINKLVLDRLNGMILSMEDLGMRVAGGDFGASFTPDGSNDEIGQFQEFFAKFVNAMTSMLRTVMSKRA